MRTRMPVLAGLALASLLFLSCEQIFTWPALSSLSRPAPVLPADISLAELRAAAEYALEIGDRDLASATLSLLLERLAGLEGDSLNSASLLCGNLALLRSGISSAVSRASLVMFSAGEEGFTEAQSAEFESARSSVSLDETGMQGLAVMLALEEGLVSGIDMAFAGTALVLSTLEGRLLSSLTADELAAIQADEIYLGGMLIFMQGLLLNEEEGGDPTMLTVMAALVSF